MAGRAAELERQGKDVLVISYNVTLLNFLRDGVVRFGADPRRITWLHFHGWCKRTLLELGCEHEYKALFAAGSNGEQRDIAAILDVELPALVAAELDAVHPSRVQMYDAVLVDEGQDMLPAWWQVLRSVAKPRPAGEMMLAADRGQDVYLRNSTWTEEAMLGAGFSGPWFDLRTSYRMPRQLTKLARVYLERFHPDPDGLLPEPPAQEEFDTDICRLRWVQTSPESLADDAVEAVRTMIIESRRDGADSDLAFADVVFLCDTLELGREVVEKLAASNVRVVDTFAPSDREQRRQKRYFFKGSERVKATTFHSFKGWEGRARCRCR